ncbi:LysR substrate-binding domain-containing protein (plasmid) [Agrobacterium leguminum]|uniref:HTH-type transcriptional regulator TtuA n=1 Tax=Agrobacterium deltaense NCPPB 1641 TaxID=1183425 RepID=A0A1S7U9C2_9HYPH|nr:MULTISPECIES: LysR substrate-binding domain-containing protein [Agrobacterium]WFS70110.1 LysR substrate-binding domain-containing protein [Agrobacterium leguminum]CVI63534.1 LysR family transcriptional regulator [Agrobacterium deltaense NCPPB 1641]
MDFRRRLVPDLVFLRSFDSAARHENFTLAAQELNLTQSTISRHILELEQQLGVSLFTRIRRQVLLTDIGRKFHKDIEKLLADSDAIMARTISSSSYQQTLRIAAPTAFMSRWLIPRLSSFTQKWQNLHLDLFTFDRPFELEEQACDIAFHLGKNVWPNGHCRYLCKEILLPVCAPGLVRNRDVQKASGLLDLPLIQNSTRPLLWQGWFEMTGLPLDLSLTGSRVDSFSAIISAACNGLGVALLPTYLIEQELKDKVLVPAINLSMINQDRYYLVTSEKKADKDVIEEFCQWTFASVKNRDRFDSV